MPVGVKRKRGRQTKEDAALYASQSVIAATSGRVTIARSTRVAAKVARKSIKQIAPMMLANENTKTSFEPESGELKNVNDLWTAYGWSSSIKKNLPSKHQRTSDGELDKTNPVGWACIRQCIVDMVSRGADILFPAAPIKLLEKAAESWLGNDLDCSKLESTLIEAYNASPANTTQRRILKACLVKGVRKKRLKELNRLKRVEIGSSAERTGYKDMKLILQGCELTKGVEKRKRVSDDLVMNSVSWILTC